MSLFGIMEKSARTRKGRLATACLPVLEAMERVGTRIAPGGKTSVAETAAVVEPLEPRVQLSGVLAAGVSGQGGFVAGQPYSLNLFTTGGFTIVKWVVYWNDVNNPSSSTITYTNSAGFSNPYTVGYTYQNVNGQFGPDQGRCHRQR